MSTPNHHPRTALVTGATSGLGKEIALRLARDDMQVIVVGRDADRGAAVVAQIKEAGGEARFLAADLNDEGEGSPVDLASFTDANPNAQANQFTVAIDWGDKTDPDETGMVQARGGQYETARD